MADYMCKHCKFNNNGWCVAKKKNRLSEVLECDQFKTGKYGGFDSDIDHKPEIKNIDYKESWQELKSRLQAADYEIWKLIDHKTSDDELKRLKGKHEGINLALSYIDELDRV